MGPCIEWGRLLTPRVARLFLALPSVSANALVIVSRLLIIFFFFFLNHTAFKLISLWHVGYSLDDFYGFFVCSRLGLLPYNYARRPDSTEPPQLLGLLPSYFLVIVTPRPSSYSPPMPSTSSPSSTLRSNRSMSHESCWSRSPGSFLPTSVSSRN